MTTATDVIPRTEQRLAIVMNGGVSLAVWMGGATLELDNLRRASSGYSEPPVTNDARGEAAHRLFETWRQLAAEARMTFTVDVIAGTSAGGINGVLLATGIARGAPLSGLRELWMHAPQLARKKGLMAPQGRKAASVLNGCFFQDEIAKAIDLIVRLSREDEAADVSLTVTATALQGNPRVARDVTGTVFDAADHRRRFQFEHVTGQVKYAAATGFHLDPRCDFMDLDALKLVARASASFPVAFAPVPEIDTLRAQRIWPTWDAGQGVEYLADGGLLDNSPFGPVLDAIAAQPVQSSWKRHLCYVVPSVDGRPSTPPLRPGAALPPPPWTSVAGAAIGDPREADLRDDVEQMGALIRAGRTTYDVSRFRRLTNPRYANMLQEGVTLATAGFALYKESRFGAAVYEVRDIVTAGNPESFLDAAIAVGPDLVGGPHPWLPADFPSDLPETWTWGLAPADRLVTLLIRSLALDLSPAADEARKALSVVDARLDAIRRAVKSDLRGPGNGAALSTVATTVALADQTFTSLRVPAALATVVAQAVTAYAEATGLLAETILRAALCVEIVNGAGGAPANATPAPLFDFLRLGPTPIPSYLAPIPADGAGPIPLASPADVIYGTRLNHFAAFVAQEWREWDFLWGRIHAATRLVALLNPDDPDTALRQLVDDIILAEGWTEQRVRDGLRTALEMTTPKVIQTMRERGLMRPAVDAMFTLLGSRLATDPKLLPLLRYVSAALAPSSPGLLGPRLLAVRAAATPVRWWMRRKLKLRP